MHQVSFDPAHPTILSSCGSEGIIRFWNTQTCKQVYQLPAKENAITAGCFNSTGTLFAYAVGNDYSQGKIWNTVQDNIFVHRVQVEQMDAAMALAGITSREMDALYEPYHVQLQKVDEDVDLHMQIENTNLPWTEKIANYQNVFFDTLRTRYPPNKWNNSTGTIAILSADQQQQQRLESLPHEMLQEIMSFVPFESWKNLSLVNRTFRQIVFHQTSIRFSLKPMIGILKKYDNHTTSGTIFH